MISRLSVTPWQVDHLVHFWLVWCKFQLAWGLGVPYKVDLQKLIFIFKNLEDLSGNYKPVRMVPAINVRNDCWFDFSIRNAVSSFCRRSILSLNCSAALLCSVSAAWSLMYKLRRSCTELVAESISYLNFHSLISHK